MNSIKLLGQDRIKVIHINDSKNERGADERPS